MLQFSPGLFTCCKVRENTKRLEWNPPLRRMANFKWADSVTVKPKAELLRSNINPIGNNC